MRPEDYSARVGSPAQRVARLVGLDLFIAFSVWSPVGAAPVEVRFLEGVSHGFLILRSTTGQKASW